MAESNMTEAAFARFFAAAGELQRTTQLEREGTSPPHVVHVVRFEYLRGWAEYDGREWRTWLAPQG